MAFDDASAIAWTQRRVGFGFGPGELDAAVASGIDGYLTDLVGVSTVDTERSDPWDDDRYAVVARGDERRDLTIQGIAGWLDLMVSSSTPLQEWMAWFWHGHLVTGIQKVQVPYLMVRQTRLFRSLGLGNFGDLLRAVTTDGAMLIYLDGVTSTAGSPNENFSRELLELFALGIGEYSEADVQAGAAALTGWVIRPRRGDFDARLVPRRHDDRPRTFLGQSVSDADSVIDAVLSHNACARFVTDALCDTIWGTGVGEQHRASLADSFRADYELRPLVRNVLELSLHEPTLRSLAPIAPVPWLISAQKALGSVLPVRLRLGGLRQCGQVPWSPPNVAGWPGGSAWLASALLVARFNLAASIAPGASDAALDAADSGAYDELAWILGLADGFGDATTEACAELPDGAGAERLTIALASPDLVTA